MSASPTPTEVSDASELSLASTYHGLDRGDDSDYASDSEASLAASAIIEDSMAIGNHSAAADTRPSTDHQRLTIMLEALRSELPCDLCDAIEAVIDRVLDRRILLTKPQFQSWVSFVAKDNLVALRQACALGRERLEAQGLRMGARRPAPDACPTPERTLPPESAVAITRRALPVTSLSSRGRAIAKCSHGNSTLARVRAQVLLTHSRLVDECESDVAQLSL